jgi:hypothetical protein
MPILIVALLLPALIVGIAWALPYLRRGWNTKPLRLKASAGLLTLAAYVLFSALMHAAAALWSTCRQPDCAMGYVLGVALLLPVGLFFACSGLLLRARPAYAVAGHLLLALPIGDFLLWALRTDYDSIITWAG